VFFKINNYLKILCFFNLVSCSFIGKNNLILAAELPRQISLNEENSQKQIFIKTPLENISQPKYFGDENFGDENSPIFLTQTTSTLPKDDPVTTFIIGLNAGKRNIRDGVLVRGEVKDKDAINFDKWLIPYDDVLQTLKFTSKSISDHEVELRSPFKVIHFDTNKLHNDPELGLVLSTKEIKDIFGIESKFDWREYAIVFDIPDIKSEDSNNIEKKPVIITGLPKISPPDITLSMVEQKTNLTGTTTSDLKNQGTLSAVGTILDSSWFLRLNQGDMTDSKTWQLSDLQILKQTDSSWEKSPLKVTVSSVIADDIKLNTNVIWDGNPNFYATLSNDLKSTRYTFDFQILKHLKFNSNGDLDKDKNFGLGYSSSSGNSSTSALVNINTNAQLNWSLNQTLGKLSLNHSGNQSSTSSQLSYVFNPSQSLIFKYETLNSSQNANLLSAYWHYTSPMQTKYGENLWQGELGYRMGSLGTGLYGTLGTTILPGILLQARYEGVSLNSDQSSLSIQLVSSLGFQGGITPSDRQIERFRTQGGLLIKPFLDRNSNGKRDHNQEIYHDNSDFLMINNEPVISSQLDIHKDNLIIRLPPGIYRIDLDTAGFPPDFQPAISTFAVQVVEGSYTPIFIPLQPAYTLAGTLTDSKGNPIAGAKVEAIDNSSKSSVISITNNAGVFYLEQLRQGSYQLKVNGKSAEPNTITIKADANILQELNLKLP
jgi:hypothetical protein